jgi:hypothetical protein
MSTQIQSQVLSEVRQIYTAAKESVEALTQVGERWVKIIDSTPNVYEIIQKELPEIPISALQTIELIGRRKLHPRLLMDNSWGAKKLAELPYDRQEEYIEKPVPVVIHRGETMVTEFKRVNQLTRNEADRVFNSKRLREPREQIEMIVNHATAAEKVKKLRYHIDGDAIEFYAASRFSRAELEKILSDWKPTALEIETALKGNQIK